MRTKQQTVPEGNQGRAVLRKPAEGFSRKSTINHVQCWKDQERELRSEFGNMEVTGDPENGNFHVELGIKV